jgi:prepilin-type processing-associated H-X9-DG protein
MLFNPQINDPFFTNGLSGNPLARLFPKTSSLIPGRLFGMDCLRTFTNNLFTMSGWGPNTFAHYPSRGFNVLFTDGSVQFVQNHLTFDMAAYGLPGDVTFNVGIWDRLGYEFLFGFLEDRPPQYHWDWDWSLGGGGGYNP